MATFQFGNIKFEAVTGFTSLSFTKSKNFTEQDRLEGKPTLQSVGGKLDEIEGEMKLDYSLPGMTVSERMAEIQAAYDSEKDELFMDGTGKIYGRFVIEWLSFPILNTTPQGSILSAIINIKFREYVIVDPSAEAKLKAQKSAFASVNAKPIERKVVPTYQSSPSLVMRDIIGGKAAATTLSKNVKDAASNPPLAVKKLNEGLRNLQRADASLKEAYKNIDLVQGKITNATVLKSSVSSVISDLAQIKNNYNFGNVQGIKALVIGMDNNILNLNNAAVELTSVVTLRK